MVYARFLFMGFKAAVLALILRSEKVCGRGVPTVTVSGSMTLLLQLYENANITLAPGTTAVVLRLVDDPTKRGSQALLQLRVRAAP